MGVLTKLYEDLGYAPKEQKIIHADGKARHLDDEDKPKRRRRRRKPKKGNA